MYILLMIPFRIVITVTVTGEARSKGDKGMFFLSLKEVLNCFMDAVLTSWKESHKLKVEIKEIKAKRE